MMFQWGCRKETSSEALTIFAASSLTDAFEEVGSLFRTRYPGAHLSYVFGGSQVLRLQIQQGARADLFASANLQHIASLRKTGLVYRDAPFVRNGLAVIVPRSNPAGIRHFRDLAKAKRLVVGTPSVPIGQYTLRLLRKASSRLGSSFHQRVLSRIVSQESNVRLVRAKVALGEADAAIVYNTDALLHQKRLRLISLPSWLQLEATYALAWLHAQPSRHAKRWYALLRSTDGQRILRRHGFRVVP